jgi:hypothetical protein
MTDQDPSMADRVAADVQAFVDALIDASTITRTLGQLTREQRRELLIQGAELEAQLLEPEGHKALAGQVRRVASDLRVLQPKAVATGQGDA